MSTPNDGRFLLGRAVRRSGRKEERSRKETSEFGSEIPWMNANYGAWSRSSAQAAANARTHFQWGKDCRQKVRSPEKH